MSVRSSLVLAFALLTFAVAPARADKCTGAKLKAIAKKESGLLGCQAKVASTGDSSGLSACESKVMGKFGTAFLKAGTCSGDQMTCENDADTCETNVAAAMTDTFPSKCEAAKRKAAAKLAKGELGCYSKAAAKAIALDSGCISKATGKFSAAMTKAGTCPDGGSPQTTVEQQCVAPVVTTDGSGMVNSVCGQTVTTTTSPGATTTTTLPACADNQYPTCGGACPAGQTCFGVAPTSCVCVNQGGCALSAPACNGACSAGGSCVSDSITGACLCAVSGCGSGSCNTLCAVGTGVCPPAYHCGPVYDHVTCIACACFSVQ